MMMNNMDKIRKGALMGGVIGTAMGMYAVSRMSSRQKRKMMKNAKKMFYNVKSRMNLF